MSLQIVDSHRQPVVLFGTSGDGALQRAGVCVVPIAGLLTIRGTASTQLDKPWTAELVAEVRTNSGVVSSNQTIEAATTSTASIAELRRRSGLTWEQIAHLFGVGRRSVHFWASGKGLSAANQERLGRMLAAIRLIDRGDARSTRTALMTALNDGVLPFDLLAKGGFQEFKERLGSGPQARIPSLARLSETAGTTRMPPEPEVRVGALQDSVHREVGNSRFAKTARLKRTR